MLKLRPGQQGVRIIDLSAGHCRVQDGFGGMNHRKWDEETVALSKQSWLLLRESECLFGGGNVWLPEILALVWQQKRDALPSSNFLS